MIGIPPIIGPGGERGGRAYQAIAGVGGYKFYANAEVSDAKLIKMLEMMNFYSGTVEGWVIFRNGLEGVHFGLGRRAVRVVRPQPGRRANIPAGQGHGGISGYPVFYPLDRLHIIQPKPMAEFQSTYALGRRRHKRVHDAVRIVTTSSTRPTTKTCASAFMSTLNTMWSEFFYKGITGQIDVDAEWDAYVQAWNDAGGADIVAELEKAPIVSEFRQGRRVY